jgi:membrane-associated two-gene conflict system component 1 (EACC1)
MSNTLDIQLTPRSGRYNEDDDRWRDQVADLAYQLRVETDALRVQHTSVSGTKGWTDQLILALGEAGVFTTALEVLKVWLARDKTRSIDLTYRDRDGRRQSLNVTATNANEDTLAPVIAAVAAQISPEP